MNPEQRLLDAVSRRKPCDFSVHTDADNLDRSPQWGPERVIASALLRDVLLGSATFGLTDQPLEIVGARIDDRVDLRGATIKRPLIFTRCVFTDAIDCDDARMQTTSFNACALSALRARHAQFEGSLLFHKCQFGGPIDLESALLTRDLDLRGSTMSDRSPILAKRLNVGGSVHLRDGFSAAAVISLDGSQIGYALDGEKGCFNSSVDLDGAKIGGYCSFAEAEFDSEIAVRGNGTVIGGFLSFVQATVRGLLALRRIQVGANVIMTGITISRPGDVALDLDQAKIVGDLLIRPFEEGRPSKAKQIPSTIVGYLLLSNASIEGSALIEGSLIEKGGKAPPSAAAIAGGGLQIGGDFSLAQTTVTGLVMLRDAQVSRNANFSGMTIDNSGARALDLERIRIGSDVLIRQIQSRNRMQPAVIKGQIFIINASIGGSLFITSGASISGGPPALAAIAAEGIQIGRYLVLTRSTVSGLVMLRDVQVGRTVNLSGTKIINPGAVALDMERAKIDGDVFIRPDERPELGKSEPALIDGGLRMTGAGIGGSLFIRNGAVQNGSELIFFNRLKVTGVFQFTDITCGEGMVSLANAKVGVFIDEGTQWPKAGMVLLNGFEYGLLSGNSRTDWRSRLNWLRGFKPKAFNPQPFTMLSSVLRRAGHDYDAKMIAIARHREARTYMHPGLLPWFGNLLMDVTCGYGYRPWLAAVWMLVFLGLGTHFFNLSPPDRVPLKDAASALLREQKQLPTGYPIYNRWIYSADTLLPIVNLQQKEYWGPNGDRPRGFRARIYLLVHILAGWFFTTLFVVGVTGLIRRE